MSPEQVLEVMLAVSAWVNQPKVIIAYNLVAFISSMILIGISAEEGEVIGKNLVTLYEF